MNLVFVVSVITIASISTSDAKSASLCSESEHAELQLTHLQCTKQVEERYALLAGKFESRLPSPIASAKNVTVSNIPDPDVLQICNMMHDVVEKCGRLYQKCLDDKQYRQFLDAQLEVFIQLMTRLYNLGGEVHQCEAVQEYERSGRRDIVQSTEKCKGEEVQRLTIKYQQCIEDANIDMTQQMISHHDNHEMAFQTLCDGIHKVVHGCGEMLIDCYTQEQLDETKLGQLEMTRKVFTDLMEQPSVSSSEKEAHWKYDVGKCSAYNSASSLKPAYVIFVNTLTLLTYFLLH